MTDITETTTDIAMLPPAERALIVLSSTKTEVALRDLVTEAKAVTAVEDKASREAAHKVGMRLIKARTTIEKTGKAAREDAQAFVSAVLAEQKRLIAITATEEGRVMDLRNAYDEKLEREERERAAAEAKRVQGIKDKIAQIRALPLALAGATADEIGAEWRALDDFKADEAVFAEFTAEAQKAAEDAIAAIADLHRAAEAREKAAAEIEAERQRIAEAQRLADEQLAAERAKFEEERAALQAERDKLEAELAALKAAQAPVITPPVVVSGDPDPLHDEPPAFVDSAWVADELVEPDDQSFYDEGAVAWEKPAEVVEMATAPTDFRIRRAALATADQFDAIANKTMLCGFTAFAANLQDVAAALRDGAHDAALAAADAELLAEADRQLLDATVAAIEALEPQAEAA